MKKLLTLTTFLLTHISFASNLRVIDGKDYLTIYYYYVETVDSQGSLIAEGSNNNRLTEYYVYGLTNVYSGRNYFNGDNITGSKTNDYAISTGNKYPAIVLVSNEFIARAYAADAKAKQEAAKVVRDANNAAKNIKMKKLAEKTFIYLQNQATNGSPSCQFELGLKYIKGQYPAETNRELGLYWMEAAAAKDSPEAKQYIENIK